MARAKRTETKYLLEAGLRARSGSNYWIGLTPEGDICYEGDTLMDLQGNCQGATVYGVLPPTVEEVVAAEQAKVAEIVYALPGECPRSNGPPIRRKRYAAKQILWECGDKWYWRNNERL